MEEVIELSDVSDDIESFYHDLSDRDEWVAEGYSGGDSEASEDEEGEIAEDQVTNDGQGEEDSLPESRQVQFFFTRMFCKT